MHIIFVSIEQKTGIFSGKKKTYKKQARSQTLWTSFFKGENNYRWSLLNKRFWSANYL